MTFKVFANRQQKPRVWVRNVSAISFLKQKKTKQLTQMSAACLFLKIWFNIPYLLSVNKIGYDFWFVGYNASR